MSIRSDSPTFPTYLQTCKMSKTRKLNRLIYTLRDIIIGCPVRDLGQNRADVCSYRKAPKEEEENCILRLLGQKEIIQKRAYLKSRFEK